MIRLLYGQAPTRWGGVGAHAVAVIATACAAAIGLCSVVLVSHSIWLTKTAKIELRGVFCGNAVVEILHRLNPDEVNPVHELSFGIFGLGATFTLLVYAIRNWNSVSRLL